ncbi:MAG: hypothetical protein JJU35_10190 [Balneolales bacterium]|nr:hypothetical protein [Balneolales bacterium]
MSKGQQIPADDTYPKSSVWQLSAVRAGVFLLLVSAYIVLVRPGRALITQQLVYPLTEQLIAAEPDRYHLPEVQKSVTFTLYERSGTGWKEHIYSTPWGFYMILPMLFFCFLTHYKPYLYVHAGMQLLFGLLAVLAYLLSLSLFEGFMHVYRMLTYYLTPGASFIIIFAAVFRQSFMQNKVF